VSTKIVYGKYLIVDADTVIPSGALYIDGDRVADYGEYGQITRRYKADRTLGSSETLVMPGLVNAHSHGKGLTDFQRGHLDDTLETWKWRSFPPVDPYLDTRWACIQLLESGVTATMHHHGLVRPEAYEEEFESVLKAYEECGVRVAFAPTLNTENVFTYGEDEAFLRSLPGEVQELCRGIFNRMALFGESQYFQAVLRLREHRNSPRVQIFHGPLSPQWVREEALQEIRRQAVELGMRIHIHVQQTQLQRLYGLKRYGKSIIAHLADIGFLGPEVTCGHCVWISEQDIELLAASGASVTHHPGCNLRVRNGISPVFELLRRGVTVALGMDEKEVSDDKDFLAEMRVAAKLHRLSSHGLDSPCLRSRDLLRMATEAGARVLGFDRWIGSLERGKQADVVLVDFRALSGPYACESLDPRDLLLYRGKAEHVRTVLVAGEVMMEDKKLARLDREEAVRRLRESIPADYADRFRRANAPFAKLRSAITAHFAPWYEEIALWEKQPYYFLNNRL
jgi:cytosine/adenosine deaminase-related metal-dependent hydrolase